MKKEIKFYIPFSLKTIKFNYNLVDMLERFPECFYDNYKIGAFYGCFGGSIWNGGSRHSLEQTTSTYISEICQYMRNHNIPIRLTFTNRLLEEKHLYDTYSNMMLDCCKLGNNEILVASTIMENYIKNEWPQYKVVKSTCWSDEVPYDDSDRFYMSVLNRNKNDDDVFLSSIKRKDKVEVMLNEYCDDKCPFAFQHYDTSSRECLSFVSISDFCVNHSKKILDNQMFFSKKIKRDGHGEYVSKDRLQNILIPMGFSNFKIVGRSYSLLSLIIDTVYYMVKPEYHDDMIIDLASGVLENMQVL